MRFCRRRPRAALIAANMINQLENDSAAMTTTQAHDRDDMPDEIDFSGGERGKFYRENARLRRDGASATKINRPPLSVMPKSRPKDVSTGRK